ncbi:hypothetical protein Ahy_B03g061716 isoform H [Arachis hypogaea]|uniref:Uncharacterized protein n=1 Tax=Arachis hypogaea TaxID=3818 RepID=A0A444ZRY6_ARAHY|nr:hypothetical protein Ahy_B03g061716 isoform H [Arachis hypogaea]
MAVSFYVTKMLLIVYQFSHCDLVFMKDLHKGHICITVYKLPQVLRSFELVILQSKSVDMENFSYMNYEFSVTFNYEEFNEIMKQLCMSEFERDITKNVSSNL